MIFSIRVSGAKHSNAKNPSIQIKQSNILPWSYNNSMLLPKQSHTDKIKATKHSRVGFLGFLMVTRGVGFNKFA